MQLRPKESKTKWKPSLLLLCRNKNCSKPQTLPDKSLQSKSYHSMRTRILPKMCNLLCRELAVNWKNLKLTMFLNLKTHQTSRKIYYILLHLDVCMDWIVHSMPSFSFMVLQLVVVIFSLFYNIHRRDSERKDRVYYYNYCNKIFIKRGDWLLWLSFSFPLY